jgi:dienelactone hydrolase
MIHPDFGGTFDNPESNGSDEAIQDVIDAVDFARDAGGIDEERVYVAGFSGGGQMSLLLVGRHPDRFAGAVSFVPIHDLVDWHAYNRGIGADDYADDIESACGGDPSVDVAARDDCLHRSPISHIDAAADTSTPVFIAHGIEDDVALPDHAVLPFNQLADDADVLSDDAIEAVRRHQLPDELDGTIEAEHFFDDEDPEVRLSRRSGEVTLVIFDGGHDFVFHPGLRWLYQLAGGDPGLDR